VTPQLLRFILYDVRQYNQRKFTFAKAARKMLVKLKPSHHQQPQPPPPLLLHFHLHYERQRTTERTGGKDGLAVQKGRTKFEEQKTSAKFKKKILN